MVSCQLWSGAINCPLLLIFLQLHTEKPPYPEFELVLLEPEREDPWKFDAPAEQSPQCWFSSPLDDEGGRARMRTREGGGQVGEPCFCQTASDLSENCTDPVGCEMVC